MYFLAWYIFIKEEANYREASLSSLTVFPKKVFSIF